MAAARVLLVIGVVFLGCFGCEDQKTSRVSSAARTPTKPEVPPGYKPPEVVILSGTTLRRAGELCRLLGVKESAEPAVRDRAKRFAEDWLSKVKGETWIENDMNPLRDGNGVTVIWLIGRIETSNPSLNALLVKEGLVEIDEVDWPNCTWQVKTKEGSGQANWRHELAGAQWSREHAK